jgi:hypothetical protein
VTHGAPEETCCPAGRDVQLLTDLGECLLRGETEVQRGPLGDLLGERGILDRYPGSPSIRATRIERLLEPSR